MNESFDSYAENYDEALSLIERYLTFFPTFVEALQGLMDIVQRMIAPLPTVERVETLIELSDRIDPYWVRLRDVPNLAQDHPLADLKLEKLTADFTRKFAVAANSLRENDPIIAFTAYEHWTRWSQRMSLRDAE